MKKLIISVSVIFLMAVSNLQAQNQIEEFEKAEQKYYRSVLSKVIKMRVEGIKGIIPLREVKKEYKKLLNERGIKLQMFDSQNATVYEDLSLSKSIKSKSFQRKFLENQRRRLRGENYYKIAFQKYLKKSEFETMDQFKDRARKFKAKRDAVTEQSDQAIENLFKPYGSLQKFSKEYISKDAVNDKNQKLSALTRKYKPIVKSYIESEIKEIKYDAEKQVFYIKVASKNRLKRSVTKKYTFQVSQSEAANFKNNKEQHQYAFMLQDLRAVIVNNKIYKPESKFPWYTHLLCETENEPVLVNGKANGNEILKNLIQNDAKIKQIVFTHKNSLTKNLMKHFKAEVEIITDKNGEVTNSQYEHGITYTGLRDHTIHYESKVPNYPLDKLLSKITDRILEMMKKTAITPRKEKCEPKRTIFNFVVEFRK
ncbi:MAG: hypothetical protein GKR88_15495 [Flavobacteriaceae bacterium]|nr:MAG: hypothetical protein GKR88_15495 [Flavobacteriaceae bacterium]